MPRRPSLSSSGNSGYLAHRTGDRLVNISRFFTKIARHGQKHGGGPPIPWNPRREAYVHHITENPSFQALHTTEEDFRHLAGDLEPTEKKRIYIMYEENTHPPIY